MKDDRRLLVTLSVMAALAVLASLVLTVRSLTGLRRTTELCQKTSADIGELTALRQRSQQLNAIVAARETMTEPSIPISKLLQTALPVRTATSRELEPVSTVPGWTARRVSVVLTDVTGDELGNLFQEATRCQPPWAILDCTLFASPTPGRLTKAELTLGMVERAAGAQR